MSTTLEILPTLAFAVVMVCWFVFGGIFLFRTKPTHAPDRSRDPRSRVGFILQVLAYAIVWGWRREAFTPVFSGNRAVAVAACLGAVLTAIGSVWIIMTAIKTLGKEWSITARLVEGHQLATSGPYAFVRHPIYTGMLGMLLATGLAVSYWQGIIAALGVLIVGAMIRIRSEERLLSAAFGSKFDDYSRRVPRLIPGIF